MKTVLLDLDGVVLDTRAALSRSFRHGLTASGINPSTPQARHALAAGEPSFLLQVAGSPERFSSVLAAASRHFHRQAQFTARPHAGIGDALRTLQASGWCIMLVTVKTKDMLCRLFQQYQMSAWFNRVCLPMHSACPHLRRAQIGELCAQRSLEPRSTVWLTDDPRDVSAAEILKMDSVFTTYGRSKFNRRQAGKGAIVHTVSDMVGAVSGDKTLTACGSVPQHASIH